MDAEIRARADAFVNEAINTAPSQEKHPLFRAPPPAHDFPITEVLALRYPAEALHVLTQAPVAMCAQSVLAAATLAIMPHRDVLLPGSVGARPLVGLFLTVGESGERKTGVDRLALRAVHRFERALEEAHEADTQSYTNAAEAWRAARAAAVKTAKGDRAAIRTALDDTGPEPRKPASPMLLVADPTPEALVMHLTARPWGGLFTSEGGQLIGGAAFNNETRLRTGAMLNALWDGEPVRRVRIGTGTSFLPGRRCTVHIMLQPVLLARLFGDAELGGIGVLARALPVFPETTAGTRLYRPADPVAEAEMARYDDAIALWLNRKPRMRDGNPDALDPEPIPLSPDAQAIWIAFYDETEAAQREGGRLAVIRPFASKLAEHAARLAAVLALYEDPDAIEVPAEAMAGGIALARHYCGEVLRLDGTAGITMELQRAEALLRWWRGTGETTMHLARAYQFGPNALRNKATALEAFTVLVEHGWAVEMRAGAEVDGAKRRKAWRLVD